MPIAVIVTVVVDSPGRAVKNARLAGSVKVVVDESCSTKGGNMTVSVPDPNGPAGMG